MNLDKAMLVARMETGKVEDKLVIDPYLEEAKPGQQLAASIDFHLGNRFMYPKHRRTGRAGSVQDESREDFRNMFVESGSALTLYPGQYILGITLEWFKVPLDLMGTVTGRSAWGRRGLIISMATAIHPGASGNVTLELFNASSTEIQLLPGQALGQIVFSRIEREVGWTPPSDYANGWCAMVEPELKAYVESRTERLLRQLPTRDSP